MDTQTFRLRGAQTALALLILFAPVARPYAADWRVSPVTGGAGVSSLSQTGAEVLVKLADWHSLALCTDSVVCIGPTHAPPRQRAARDGIPDGHVATVTSGRVRSAWYVLPTTRYRHGALGDLIEAGGLAIRDSTGRRFELELPGDRVFEDLTPRLVDLDGDGTAEIVTIRTDVAKGAALAIYDLQGDELVELAATSPIGLTHRWLNIAGIADFNGDGTPDIALVKTPHIGGTLEFWTLSRGKLTRIAAAAGFSNHVNGTTEQGLSAVADINGDGVADLVLPNADRRTLRMVSLRAGRIVDETAVHPGGAIVTAIGQLTGPGGPVFVMGLDNGQLVLVRAP